MPVCDRHSSLVSAPRHRPNRHESLENENDEDKTQMESFQKGLEGVLESGPPCCADSEWIPKKGTWISWVSTESGLRVPQMPKSGWPSTSRREPRHARERQGPPAADEGSEERKQPHPRITSSSELLRTLFAHQLHFPPGTEVTDVCALQSLSCSMDHPASIHLTSPCPYLYSCPLLAQAKEQLLHTLDRDREKKTFNL